MVDRNNLLARYHKGLGYHCAIVNIGKECSIPVYIRLSGDFSRLITDSPRLPNQLRT